MRIIKIWILVVTVLLTTGMKGCGSNPVADIYKSPDELAAALKNTGYTMLPLPDSSYGPGVIFMVSQEQGLNHIGTLESCGVPAKLRKPKSGASPGVSTSAVAGFGANVVIGVKGISAGPEFAMAKKANLNIEGWGSDYIEIGDVNAWLTDPANASKLTKKCLEWLNQPNVFLINDAAVIRKGKYTLYDDKSVKIDLKGLKLKGIIEVAAGANAHITGEGQLEFNEPVYVAVKKARRFGDIVRPLAPPGAETAGDTADVLIEQLRKREQ